MSYRRINIFSRIIRYSSFVSLSHSSTLLIEWAVCHAPAPLSLLLSCSSFYNGLIPIHGIKKYVLFIDFHMTSQLNAHISYLYYITLFAESFGSFSHILRCPPPPLHPLTPPSNRLDDVWKKKKKNPESDEEKASEKEKRTKEFRILYFLLCISDFQLENEKMKGYTESTHIWRRRRWQQESLNAKKIIHVILFVFTLCYFPLYSLHSPTNVNDTRRYRLRFSYPYYRLTIVQHSPRPTSM